MSQRRQECQPMLQIANRIPVTKGLQDGAARSGDLREKSP